MRWRFFDPSHPVEAAEHRATVTRIEEWWSAFAGKTQDLDALFRRDGVEWDLPGWMHEHLQAIDPNLMWEFGPAVSGKGHRLVITPESRRELRPLVDSILQRAPRIPHWEFYSARLPEPAELATQTVQLRTGVDITDTTVLVSRGQFNQIDLAYHFQSPSTEDENQGAFVATEALLGEEILDRWIGKIEARTPGQSKGDSRLIPLRRVKPTVEALISSTLEQLPKTPLYIHERPGLPGGEERTMTLFKCDPEQQADYNNRDDILFAISSEPERFKALQQSPMFYSGRFSRRNELFVYLKIDWGDATMKDRFESRVRVEELIDKALVAAKVGCVVGGGTGLRYAYIDMALAHVDAAMGLLVRSLRAAKIPNRSWVLFFDATLKQEWVGIYEDTPPPPGLEA